MSTSDPFNRIRNEAERHFPLPSDTIVIPVGTISLSSPRHMIWEENWKIENSDFMHTPGSSNSSNTFNASVSVANTKSVNLVFRGNSRLSGQILFINNVEKGNLLRDIVVVVNELRLGGNSINVEIRTREENQNARIFKALLSIHNLGFIGAGVFKIPVLPVSIVYAPFLDRGRQNKAIYSITETFGNTFTSSFSQGSQTTRPGQSRYDTIEGFVGALSDISSKIGNKLNIASLGSASLVLSSIKQGIDILQDAVGEVIESSVIGATSTGENSIKSTSTTQMLFETSPNQGIGHDDIYVIRRNVEFAWFATEGNLVITCIFPGREARIGGNQIKTNTAEIDSESTQMLLSINPNFADPIHPPNSNRFIQLGPQEGMGGFHGRGFAFSETFEEQNIRGSINSRITIRDEREGWLSFLGFGPEETRTVTMTNTHTKIRGSFSSRTVTTELFFFQEPDEDYTILMFYDCILGTYLFRKEANILTIPEGGFKIPEGIFKRDQF